MASKPFEIPWKCLDESSSVPIAQKSDPNKKPIPHKTFAQAVKNVCDIPQNQLPKPTLKGNEFAIAIPDEEYDIVLEECKNNLQARILWPKGSTPLTMAALRTKLLTVWKHLGRWGITSLGKGFYELSFSSVEDANSVRSVGSWNLNPRLLKLFAWTRENTQVMQLSGNGSSLNISPTPEIPTPKGYKMICNSSNTDGLILLNWKMVKNLMNLQRRSRDILMIKLQGRYNIT
jgi:hypothetical protein